MPNPDIIQIVRSPREIQVTVPNATIPNLAGYATISYVSGVSGFLQNEIVGSVAGVATVNSITGSINILGASGIGIINSGQTIFIYNTGTQGGITGNYYPLNNPNFFSTSGNLTSVSGILQSEITNLTNNTGLYYLNSNPSGFVTGINTGILTSAFYSAANPNNFSSSGFVISISGALQNETNILSGNLNNYYLLSNPNNYVNSGTLVNYYTTGQTIGISGFLQNEINNSNSNITSLLNQTGLYYLNSNPSGYLQNLNGTGVLTGSFYGLNNSNAYSTSGNLLSTSGALAALISDSSAGVATLNSQSGVINLIGTGIISVSNIGQNIYVSGNVSGLATSGALSSASGALQNQINIIDGQTGNYYLNSNPSGFITGNNLYVTTGQSGQFASATSLLLTGQILQSEINVLDSVTGLFVLTANSGTLVPTGLTGSLATVLNLFNTGATLQNELNILSGNLSTTGSNITILQNEINILSGNLALTGSNLHSQITGLGLSGVLVNGNNAGSGKLINVASYGGYATGVGFGAAGYIVINGSPSNGQTIKFGDGVNSTIFRYESSPSQANDFNLSLGPYFLSNVFVSGGLTINAVYDGNVTINFKNTVASAAGNIPIVNGLSNITSVGMISGQDAPSITKVGSSIPVNINESGSINTSGTITASVYYGNGSGLSGITGYYLGSNLNSFCTSGNLISASGAIVALINASTEGVSSINGSSGIVTLQGAGNVSVTTSGSFITISGSNALSVTGYATSGNLLSTSGVLQTEINNIIAQTGGFSSVSVTGSNIIIAPNFSGAGNVTTILSGSLVIVSGITGAYSNFLGTGQTGQFASAINLFSTGQTLQNEINTIESWSGTTPSLFYGINNNNNFSTSGNLANVSGVLQSEINILSGNLNTSGANLQAQITNLSGHDSNTFSQVSITGSNTVLLPVFTGMGNVVVSLSGSTVNISGNTSGLATTGALTAVSGVLQTEITSLINWTGTTNSIFYPLSNTNAYSTSGFVVSVSGVLQNEINVLSGNLFNSGITLQTEINTINNLTGLFLTGFNSGQYVTNTQLNNSGFLTGLVQGSNITVSNNHNGSFTINSTASGSGGGAPSIIWNTITGNTNISTGNSYIVNGTGLVTLTLPTICSAGNPFTITSITNIGWQVAQNSGQSARLGIAQTTTGILGYLQSTNIGDTIALICVNPNSGFQVIHSIGNIIVN